MTYFEFMYPTLYTILIHVGWWVWLCYTLLGAVIATSGCEGSKHKASIRYYYIISVVALGVLGLLITIFTPPPLFFGIK